MKYRLSALIRTRYRNIFIQQNRNYAGHSKWQNIKADKMEQDTARSQLFKKLASKMRVIAAETDNPDPNFNPKLAGLVDQAKKANMPASTLKNILEKLKNPAPQGKTYILPIRSATGVTLILHLATNNPTAAKLNISHIIKKFNTKIIDTAALTMFECGSYIKASKEGSNIDQAMEDAIEVDAEDVEEVKEDAQTYFQFKTEFLFPDKTLNLLKNLGYSILSVDDRCIPNTVVDLDETEIKSINRMKEKLRTEVREIRKIEDNIAN